MRVATDRVFQQSFTWENGMPHPGDEPGLGVELDRDDAGTSRTASPDW